MGFLSQIGLGELTVILAILLLFFGARRIPEIGASLGKGIKEFKRAFSSDVDSQNAEQQKTLPRDF